MKYLITGGAGSLGKIICQKLLDREDSVTVLDNNESQLAAMPDKIIKRFGDISDYRTVFNASRGIDTVIHCAALKNLAITEHNTTDCVRVNVTGTQNVADAAVARNVYHAIFISSDKAVEPTSLYGATKLTGEHIWKTSGSMQEETIFDIIRPGNFFKSAGNVFEVWDALITNREPLPLTDIRMKRYFIDAERVADIAITLNKATEDRNRVIIPIMGEYLLLDLMKEKYGVGVRYHCTGIRQGEKLQEKLKYDAERVLSKTESYMVVKYE